MKFGRIIIYFLFCLFFSLPKISLATAPVFYSISPYGAGSGYDIKNGSPTLTISSGVATLSVAQTGNIGAGLHIDFDSPSVHVFITPNRVGFDSGGTTEIKAGDKIEENGGDASGIITAIEVTSGSWGAGTAAGYFYFSTTSGTWTDNTQIDRAKPSSSSDVATVDGTLQGNLGNGNTQFVVKDGDGTDASDVGTSETVNYIHHEYSSRSAFEAGFTDSSHINNTSLVSADVIVHGYLYYDHDAQAADTTACTTSGFTSGASNYLQFYVPVGGSESINNQRHNGERDTNKAHMIVNDDYTYNITEEYVRVIGDQTRRTYTTADWATGLRVSLWSTSDVRLGYIICDTSGGNLTALGASGNALTLYTYNCIIGPTSGNDCVNIAQDADVYVYNCTVVKGGRYCINYGGTGTVNIKNCTVAGGGTDEFNGSPTIDYCASDDGDGTNAQTLSGTRSNDFADWNGGNYRPVSGSVQLNNGTDDPDSWAGYWDDVIADERTSTWSIGAWETFLAAVGDFFPLVDGGPACFSPVDGRLAR